MYSIKTYQEGFIEDQVKIGSSMYDDWPMGGQTRADELKKTYSADNATFDPETKFYAFKDNEMVGFLTTALKEVKEGKTYYFFEFPYVLPEHAPQVETMLIEHALQSIKVKGADIAVARAGTYWGKSKAYAEQYGFEKKDVIVRKGEVFPEEVPEVELPAGVEIVEFDPEVHGKMLVEYLMTLRGLEREQAEQRLEFWKTFTKDNPLTTPWGQSRELVDAFIAVKDKAIIGHGVSILGSNYPDNSVLLNNLSSLEGEEDIKPVILKRLMEGVIKTNKKYLLVHTGSWGISVEEEPFYEQYGAEFETTLSYYEKSL